MTNEQLKEVENKLWDAANSLRAYGGLKASDYAVPVLGLIFLKFAENKYSQFEPQRERGSIVFSCFFWLLFVTRQKDNIN